MTHNRIVDAVVDIAKTLNNGEVIKSTGNRMADALDSIADSYGGSVDNPSGNRIADALEAIAENIEGSGGDHNYVETKQGTLENIFSFTGVTELFNQVTLGNVTLVLNLEGGEVLSNKPLSTSLAARLFSGVSTYTNSGVVVVCARYTALGGFQYATRVNSLLDPPTTESIDQNTQCTLTIIHHPLPEGDVAP